MLRRREAAGFYACNLLRQRLREYRRSRIAGCSRFPTISPIRLPRCSATGAGRAYAIKRRIYGRRINGEGSPGSAAAPPGAHKNNRKTRMIHSAAVSTAAAAFCCRMYRMTIVEGEEETAMTVSDFVAMMQPGRIVHLVGIGGVSMSPLAEVLRQRGLAVRGSDMQESKAVAELRRRGIPVAVGHRPEHVAGAELVIRTAAARDDNPEIVEAHRLGIPVFERTQAWGAIMQDYQNGICVAGTHGKTTTTSMLTHILLETQRDPTVMIGGTLPIIGSGYRIGKGDTILLESCEYYDSFLSFSPTVAVILNVDNDHLDYFKTLDNIKRSFRAFAQRTPANTGWVISSADDANTVEALQGLERKRLTFGFGAAADVRPAGLQEGRISRFSVMVRGERWAELALPVSGKHNILNALAACAAAFAMGLDPRAVERGLNAFHGAGRRIERKGSCGPADVYDDYAHHPSEFRALMDAVSKMGYRRTVVVFQPHTYSRLKNLFAEFAEVLRLPDRVYLADVYAAREQDTLGISSRDLAAAVPGAVYCPDFRELADRVRADLQEGDMVLTVGAGDIYRVGELLVNK